MFLKNICHNNGPFWNRQGQREEKGRTLGHIVFRPWPLKQWCQHMVSCHPLLSWEEESVQLSSLSFRRSNADSVVNMKQFAMSFSLQRCCKDHGTWLSFLLEFCKHGNCASHSIFVMRGVGQWGIVAMYHLLFIEVLQSVIIQLYFLCISGFQ